MRVGIFGGSFDPVHSGHLFLAERARERVGLDEVWFVPCQISPHKGHRPPSMGGKRLRWLELATEGLEWARVLDIELRREGPSFSYETLAELDREYPEHEWFWIMGGDQWRLLGSWARPDLLAELATFLVLARDGEEVEEREGWRMMVVPGEHPASSTAIRDALARGERGVSYLDPRVESGLRDEVCGG